MTVSEPITSLLSSVPTPWVNEAGLTPNHPPNVPALAVREAEHYHHKERKGSSSGEAVWGPHFKSSSQHNCAPRGRTQPSVRRAAASQLSSSQTAFPTRCCSSEDRSCFLSCHILTLPDGQTVLLEYRSYFYHSLHNHFWGWRCGLRLSSYLQAELKPTILPTASTGDKLSESLNS